MHLHRRINPPDYQLFELIPPCSKTSFAPDVDPSGIITDDSVFQKLSTVQWVPRGCQQTEQNKQAQADLVTDVEGHQDDVNPKAS